MLLTPIAMSENRKKDRLKTALTVQLEQGQGVVRDLSASGIYFVTDVPLKVGEPLRFTLEFQNARTGPISANCVARIVRVEKRGKLKGVAASIDRIKLYGGERNPD
jgi:hypothetical protein